MYQHRVSVAPMMGWTDRHARYFLRLISRHTLLYTEMITTGAIINGDRERLLRYHDAEHPLAVQLGGSSPSDLAECSRIVAAAGFDEINLNVGCPSDRVQSGMFGACLMRDPGLVAQCVSAMRDRVDIPVTVKCRIGVDDMDDYDAFIGFIDEVAATGCGTFIVHARKAWLQGLSPKQNREVPPLRYDYVYRLKQERPDLSIIINGGVTRIEEMRDHLRHVDGVMLGREAYQNPFILSGVDELFYDADGPERTRDEVISELITYVDQQMSEGARLHDITRHIHGLYHGESGARAWRRRLSTEVHLDGANSELLRFDMLTDRLSSSS